jgi:DNA-binding PadR family transcriptional regulator
MPEAEVERIVSDLEDAGLVTVTTDPDGRHVYRLTAEGVKAESILAMVGDADQPLEVLDGLVDETDEA